MKTPDPNHSMKYSPPSNEEADNAQPVEGNQALDPLDTLLAEEAEASGTLLVTDVPSQDALEQTDPDDERLYTDEFIRANENASRSLFLGFLGLALLATSLIAWLLLSSDQQDTPREETPEPVVVPSAPPSEIPDLRLDAVPIDPTGPDTTPQSGESPLSDESPQAPLVFPVQPTTPSDQQVAPNTTEPNTIEGTSESTPDTIPALPDGAVPPPPPINP